MATRVIPEFIDDLKLYGAEDVQLCYHCGDCSAVCPHTDEIYRFPRKSTRLLQMGLAKKLETTLEPWLCYYCGQCSEQCPRQAYPGETMMSLRRWLISRYDVTGIARLFYRSKTAEIIAVVLVALLTLTGIFFYNHYYGTIHIYDGENAFLPSSLIHTFDLLLGAFLGLLLLLNASRMWYLTMSNRRGVDIPWWLYITRFYQLPWHFFTQKRYADCDAGKKTGIFLPWLVHLGLMLGYVTMLVLVMAFLPALQSGPGIQWQVHLFGYLATIGLAIGTVYFILHRKNRRGHVQFQKSHSTDWVFVVLLFLIVVTGIFQHLFHRTGLPVAANVTYILHLMCVVPWLLRMPFTKWAHLIYRPLGMYFADVRKAAIVRQPGYTLIPQTQYAM